MENGLGVVYWGSPWGMDSLWPNGAPHGEWTHCGLMGLPMGNGLVVAYWGSPREWTHCGQLVLPTGNGEWTHCGLLGLPTENGDWTRGLMGLPMGNGLIVAYWGSPSGMENGLVTSCVNYEVP